MIKIKPATPRWKDIPEEERPKSGYEYKKYMIRNHGYKQQTWVGKIGSGTKVHKFAIIGKIEGDTLYVADCISFCGSAKWNSNLKLSVSLDMPLITCKRCKGGN